MYIYIPSYIYKSAQYICEFTLPDFHIIPDQFSCIPGGKPTPGC